MIIHINLSAKIINYKNKQCTMIIYFLLHESIIMAAINIILVC